MIGSGGGTGFRGSVSTSEEDDISQSPFNHLWPWLEYTRSFIVEKGRSLQQGIMQMALWFTGAECARFCFCGPGVRREEGPRIMAERHRRTGVSWMLWCLRPSSLPFGREAFRIWLIVKQSHRHNHSGGGRARVWGEKQRNIV